MVRLCVCQDPVSGMLCVFAIDVSKSKVKAYFSTNPNGTVWSAATVLDTSDDTYVAVGKLLQVCAQCGAGHY